MDIVYILGTGSVAGNEEIKYSIRSLKKHMRDMGRVFVVGERPEGLPGVIHIPHPDEHKKAWQNALAKTRRACEDERVSAEFLFMNDDFFANAHFEAAELPYYARKGGDGGQSGRIWYGIHAPVRYRKDLYLALPLSPLDAGEFSPRTFYCNYYRAEPVYMPECTVSPGRGVPGFDEQVAGRPFFSIGSATMANPEFAAWMAQKYPVPSESEA